MNQQNQPTIIDIFLLRLMQNTRQALNSMIVYIRTKKNEALFSIATIRFHFCFFISISSPFLYLKGRTLRNIGGFFLLLKKWLTTIHT